MPNTLESPNQRSRWLPIALLGASLSLVVFPATARVSLSDLDDRLGILEQQDQDAVEQVIIDSVTVSDGGGPVTDGGVSATIFEIQGVNFTCAPDPQATLGGVALAVTSCSATQLVASAGGGVAAGTYMLTVELAGGGGRLAFDAFEVAVGVIGPEGPEGPQGPAGADGSQGAQGNPGAEGPQGVQGNLGQTGATGLQGPEGPQGPQGPAGDPETVLTSCPPSYTLPGTNLCVTGWRNPQTYGNAQADCFDEGAHVCTKSEFYVMWNTYGTNPSFFNGDRIGNIVDDDMTLCANNTTDSINFDGTCSSSTSAWFRCCKGKGR